MCDRLLSLPPADQVEHYNEMISAGRRGDAVEFFMAKVLGLHPEFVAYARTQPFRQAAGYFHPG
jgi:hypothetical protein